MGTRNYLTPNGSAPFSNTGFTASPGGTNLVTAVNDTSDTTFVRKPSTNATHQVIYNSSTTTVNTTTAIPWRIRSLAKVGLTSGGECFLEAYLDGGYYSSMSVSTGATNIAPLTVTNRARSAGIATLTFAASTGLAVDDVIYVTGVAAAYNGAWTVTAVSGSAPWTVQYAVTDTGTEASTASSGTVELMTMVGYQTPWQVACPAAFTDQDGVDGLRVSFTDYGSSTKRGILYKALLELETTTQPTTSALTVAGIRGVQAVTAATQAGTTVSLTVAAHAFLTGDTVFITGVTGLQLGTNQGVVLASSIATRVDVQVSGSFTGTGTVSSATVMPRVTTTTYPSVGFTYTQADDIPQYAYEVHVHNASTATPGTGASLVWSSGTQVSQTALSQVVGSALANATTYWVYVRNGMRAYDPATLYGPEDVRTTYWSSYVSTTFRMDLTPPTTPTTTVSWSTPNQAATVTATGAAYGAGTQTFTIQRSIDGGTTWTAIRGGTNANTTATTLVVTDYEVVRGITARYRSLATGTPTGLTDTLATPWSTVATVTTTSDGTNWLKDPLTPALNDGGVRVLADPDYQVEEQLQVLRPLGRTDAVVVAGTLGRDDGSFTVHAATEAEWTTLRALLFSQRVLLWQDAFDQQRYIRITSRSYQRVGARGAPRYECQVSYVEVAAP